MKQALRILLKLRSYLWLQFIRIITRDVDVSILSIRPFSSTFLCHPTSIYPSVYGKHSDNSQCSHCFGYKWGNCSSDCWNKLLSLANSDLGNHSQHNRWKDKSMVANPGQVLAHKCCSHLYMYLCKTLLKEQTWVNTPMLSPVDSLASQVAETGPQRHWHDNAHRNQKPFDIGERLISRHCCCVFPNGWLQSMQTAWMSQTALQETCKRISSADDVQHTTQINTFPLSSMQCDSMTVLHQNDFSHLSSLATNQSYFIMKV